MGQLSTYSHQVCAVIVTHEPDDPFTANYQHIIEQVGHVILVDNLSSESKKEFLKRLQSHNATQVELIENSENNLAHAQNLGIQRAKARGYRWVLLFDQDSRPSEHMVERLLHALFEIEHPEQVAIIAPQIVDAHSGRSTCYLQPRFGFLFKRSRLKRGEIRDNLLGVIASGSLIPASVFDAIGFKDESFVIDYVDQEFCLRVSQHGLRIVVVGDALLSHRLGHAEDHYILGSCITTRNHSPERRFTIYRNRIRCWRKYGLSVPAWLLHDIFSMGYDLLRILLFEQNKFAKFSAAWRGTIAGFAPYAEKIYPH